MEFNLKSLVPLCLCLCITACSENKLSTDEELERSLVGFWTMHPSDEYFRQDGFITEYKKDNTAIHIQYASSK